MVWMQLRGQFASGGEVESRPLRRADDLKDTRRSRLKRFVSRGRENMLGSFVISIITRGSCGLDLNASQLLEQRSPNLLLTLSGDGT